MGRAQRVAVVGAGASGLAALRGLTAKGFDAIAYERGRAIGGVWTLEDRPTAAYRSLNLITSRARTEFAEFPMPPGTPDYPARDEVGRYLDAYATHFGLHERVRLGTGVRHARRRPGGGWELQPAAGARAAPAVLVPPTAHNDLPAGPAPPYPGADDFPGEQLHALDYREAED